VRREVEQRVSENARRPTVDGYAWRYLSENLKSMSVRHRLDLIFHADHAVRSFLEKEYNVRNEAAHDYKQLPREAPDISVWLDKLEELVDKF
jgi:hypothetical protein